eukprot:11816337-Prorocentrum_lima.AAC.1
MTSSLVGSEMCIRDRCEDATNLRRQDTNIRRCGNAERPRCRDTGTPVSYTHLTLPTICSV